MGDWGHTSCVAGRVYVCMYVDIYIYIRIIWSLERNRELYCGKTRKTIHHGRLSWRLSSWAKETCIIFDWDDTLLPTSFIEDAAWLRLLWFFQFIHVNYPIMLSAQVCVSLESLNSVWQSIPWCEVCGNLHTGLKLTTQWSWFRFTRFTIL